ncbi:hypothetical protein F5B21DRAFT_478640 [Xylaria acuta]|nr:hypothetical protein F5B21DRAFT_478640 [Xylaria acuta]
MNDLTLKHKRYKIRSINRSAARTVFKTTWNSCQIIILKLGLLDDPRSSTNTETAQFDIASPEPKTNDEHDHPSLGAIEIPVTPTGDDRQVASAPISMNSNIASLGQKKKAKAKTNYQRESSRLRQRDRRVCKRRQQRSITDNIRTGLDPQPRSLSKTLALKESVHGLDDITFAMLVMLHFAFNPRPELKMRLPPASRSQIERFLATRSAKVVLSNDDERSEFVQMKETELVGLRRLTRKLDGLTQQCYDKLHGLLKEQELTAKESTQRGHLQEHFIEPRKYWYRVLLSALIVLPRLTTESEELIDSLRSELRESREMKERRRIWKHKEWINHLIPGSETYNRLLGTLQYSEDRNCK